MAGDEMTDEEYLAAVRKAREESVRFFSSGNRGERELWVAKEFLTNLGLEFQYSELIHVKDDPPDVRFREAEFEIKEILDPGRRRHAEYKASLETANAATTPSELLEPATPKDITYGEIYVLIEEQVKKLCFKYGPSERAKMDLLFYVNLEDVYGYVATPLPSPACLRPLGFRSVSLVMGRFSGVLIASETAPEFLRNGGARIVRRPDTNE
ncbi:hypothetical protein SKTS_18840 [Sulfurimicrobium lacus]|uniref:Uncharacterized protein n=1 Tax=Sulfurimicrobium lacus TaxID=2715678 RepID=A0A6F8VBA8_9PROT|nr:DUF1780 domain-containing protein [Sulfurimicrobium lacus]BCB26998.1 hypothetical protein SKTS_18840 [Sulfurimicrobium lacus]